MTGNNRPVTQNVQTSKTQQLSEQSRRNSFELVNEKDKIVLSTPGGAIVPDIKFNFATQNKPLSLTTGAAVSDAVIKAKAKTAVSSR